MFERVNLAVFDLPWSNALEKNKLTLWNVDDEGHEDLIEIVNFDYSPETFSLGCFRVSFTDRYIENYDEFIDRVVIKYEKCSLTIELYKNKTLIEKFDVKNKDYFFIEKGNISLWVFMF